MSQESQSQSQVNEVIGMSLLCNMFIEMSNQHEKNDDDHLSLNALETAIELNPYSSDALEALAVYYEIKCRMPLDAENYYLKALEIDPFNCRILYNFANFYEETGDYRNMIHYYTLAGQLSDSDSYLALAKYYLNICKDRILFLQNYIKGVEISSNDNDYDDDDEEYTYSKKYKGYNHIELLEILESIVSPSQKIQIVIEKLKRKSDILVYKNKVRLFSRFENVCECQICYENKLNIDLHCGHEVCVDCYKIIYKHNCPWCRIPSYF
jgi:tetratricopeptide (TPR) repeat protein